MYTYESPRPPSGLSMDSFDYELPEARIAQHPIEPRDAARLLVHLDPAGAPTDAIVRDLPSFVRPGDVIVLNDTKVIPARLLLHKDTGGAVEVLLVDLDEPGEPVSLVRYSPAKPARVSDAEPVYSFAEGRRWKALVKPSKKVPVGTVLRAVVDGEELLHVRVGERVDGGQRLVELLGPDTRIALSAQSEEGVLSRVGTAPLPPYITAPLADQSRYQTTFAREPGSAAAPTAGLHITPELLDACVVAGASIHRVELCVGLDTFRPVSVDRPEDHDIHSERFRVPESTLAACQAARAEGGRVIAVGTTSVRALESAAAAGVGEGRTKLFIYGDYEFQLVDVLLTNFHLPRSSLLLLVEAFAGPRWRELYQYAIANEYRFLSFGDAMLLGRRLPSLK